MPGIHDVMGMPGILYVLEYDRNILSTRYARNSMVWKENIKHISMPGIPKAMGMPGIPYVLKYTRNILARGMPGIPSVQGE